MRRLAPLLALLALSACAATQAPDAVAPTAPGFLMGLWHGFIFPVAWVVSLFVPKVAVYAVPNNGSWYDFGYFLGAGVFVYRRKPVDGDSRHYDTQGAVVLFVIAVIIAIHGLGWMDYHPTATELETYKGLKAMTSH